MISLIRNLTYRKNLIGLAFLSAALLGISYPPVPIGVLACVGFVPFLLLVDTVDSFSRFFRYSYFTFFLFSIFTLYWVGGFTHFKDPYLMFAGIALFLWQPLFFTVPASLYYFVRKKFPHRFSSYSFPFLWVSFEWLYALGEFAFPWLTIGNTQTYDLDKIQYVEMTGVYGISFWVLLINVLVYNLFCDETGIGKHRRFTLAGIIILLYIAPNFYTAMIEPPAVENAREINVGVIQPNIDPWDKWEGANTFAGRWRQVEAFLDVIRNHKKDSLDIVVLPESAILLNLPAFPAEMNYVRKVIDSLNVSLISGYAKFKYYEPENAPVSSNTVKGSNIRWDSFNSIFLVEPHSASVQSYSKMRLVPFAERIPYAESVPFLIEPLRWGVGISNWGIGEDSTVFYLQKLQTKFLAMVCYESIFPEFVGSFVNNGAEFLVFITNDSWWGNTSGSRQHQQYAVLRAIENRRWVVRCANGGISSFIDPRGNTYEKTDMYVQSFIQHKITPAIEKTFYTKHGDWFARICASIGFLIVLISIIYHFLWKQK